MKMKNEKEGLEKMGERLKLYEEIREWWKRKECLMNGKWNNLEEERCELCFEWPIERERERKES